MKVFGDAVLWNYEGKRGAEVRLETFEEWVGDNEMKLARIGSFFKIFVCEWKKKEKVWSAVRFIFQGRDLWIFKS